MTASASLALQAAIHEALTGDPQVTGLLGGPHIFDDVPRQAAFPYVTLGQTSARDWSTGDEDGQEHVVTLHAWSRAGGKAQVHAILDAIRDALHEAALALDGHHLVNLRQEFSEARREADGVTYRGLARFRA